jgi:hypothetical protein
LPQETDACEEKCHSEEFGWVEEETTGTDAEKTGNAKQRTKKTSKNFAIIFSKARKQPPPTPKDIPIKKKKNLKPKVNRHNL